MAEFGIQAANLQSPQAAGAQVVPPVQENQAPNPAFSILGSIADVFANGLKNNAKEEAERRKNEIVGRYVKEQTTINDAISQGLDAGSAGTRSRASANKYLAQYPEYFKDFEAAGKAIKGITEQGEAEDQVKLEQDVYKGRITRAQSAGFSIDASQPKQVVDLQLKAYETTVLARTRLEDMYKANAEKRSQTSEERQVFDRELKSTSITMINDIAGAHLESSGALIQGISGDVKAGKLTPEQGQLRLSNEFARIDATLQAAASTNPELAGPYRTLFTNMQKVGMDMLDPKKAGEDMDRQIKMLVDTQKLFILGTPKNAAIVATSQLLGANAQIALSAGANIVPTIASMMNTPAGSKEYVPQVVGNPDIEKDVTGFLKNSINSLNAGKFKDPVKAKTELSNAVNQVLTQTGQSLDKGYDATKFKDLAAFFAGPEYGSYAASGLLSKEAAQSAKKTFQLSYEPTMIKGIQQKLEGYLQGQASFGQKQNAPVSVSEVVDVKFTGSGIVFEPKARKGLDPVEQADVNRSVKDLATTQAAINQLIHMGAHLEGTTNYSQYWERNKHVFMPQMFTKPTEVPAAILPTPKRSAAEDGMAAAVQLSPAERALDEARLLTPENVRALQTEIDRTKNPESKRILEEEMAKIQAKLGRG